jgi:hypothetical protein
MTTSTKELMLVTDTKTSLPYGVIVDDGIKCFAVPLTKEAEPWSAWVEDSAASIDEVRFSLHHSIQNELPVSFDSKTLRKLEPLLDAEGKRRIHEIADDTVMLEKHEKMAGTTRYVCKALNAERIPKRDIADTPIAAFPESQRKAILSYKVARMRTQHRTSAMNLQVKRVRAFFDPDIGPGGGWRCPEGTLNGGQITDRFGRGCGGGLTRRIGRALVRAGQAIDSAGQNRDQRRMDRRARRLARRAERRERRRAGREQLANRLEGAADRLVDGFDDTGSPTAERPPRPDRPERQPRPGRRPRPTPSGQDDQDDDDQPQPSPQPSPQPGQRPGRRPPRPRPAPAPAPDADDQDDGAAPTPRPPRPRRPRVPTPRLPDAPDLTPPSDDDDVDVNPDGSTTVKPPGSRPRPGSQGLIDLIFGPSGQNQNRRIDISDRDEPYRYMTDEELLGWRNSLENRKRMIGAGPFTNQSELDAIIEEQERRRKGGVRDRSLDRPESYKDVPDSQLEEWALEYSDNTYDPANWVKNRKQVRAYEAKKELERRQKEGVKPRSAKRPDETDDDFKKRIRSLNDTDLAAEYLASSNDDERNSLLDEMKQRGFNPDKQTASQWASRDKDRSGRPDPDAPDAGRTDAPEWGLGSEPDARSMRNVRNRFPRSGLPDRAYWRDRNNRNVSERDRVEMERRFGRYYDENGELNERGRYVNRKLAEDREANFGQELSDQQMDMAEREANLGFDKLKDRSIEKPTPSSSPDVAPDSDVDESFVSRMLSGKSKVQERAQKIREGRLGISLATPDDVNELVNDVNEMAAQVNRIREALIRDAEEPFLTDEQRRRFSRAHEIARNEIRQALPSMHTALMNDTFEADYLYRSDEPLEGSDLEGFFSHHSKGLLSSKLTDADRETLIKAHAGYMQAVHASAEEILSPDFDGSDGRRIDALNEASELIDSVKGLSREAEDRDLSLPDGDRLQWLSDVVHKASENELTSIFRRRFGIDQSYMSRVASDFRDLNDHKERIKSLREQGRFFDAALLQRSILRDHRILRLGLEDRTSYLGNAITGVDDINDPRWALRQALIKDAQQALLGFSRPSPRYNAISDESSMFYGLPVNDAYDLALSLKVQEDLVDLRANYLGRDFPIASMDREELDRLISLLPDGFSFAAMDEWANDFVRRPDIAQALGDVDAARNFISSARRDYTGRFTEAYYSMSADERVEARQIYNMAVARRNELKENEVAEDFRQRGFPNPEQQDEIDQLWNEAANPTIPSEPLPNNSGVTGSRLSREAETGIDDPIPSDLAERFERVLEDARLRRRMELGDAWEQMHGSVTAKPWDDLPFGVPDASEISSADLDDDDDPWSDFLLKAATVDFISRNGVRFRSQPYAVSESGYDDSLVVTGNIFATGADGVERNLGTFTRHFYPNGKIYNAYLSMNNVDLNNGRGITYGPGRVLIYSDDGTPVPESAVTSRGSGFATVFNNHVWNFAKEAGFTYADTSPGLSDGPYVWGRFGYRPKSMSDVRDAWRRMETEVANFDAGVESIITNGQQAEILRMLAEKARNRNYNPSASPSQMEISFALELGTSDRDRKRQVRDWMQNENDLALSEGRFDIAGQDITPLGRPPRNPGPLNASGPLNIPSEPEPPSTGSTPDTPSPDSGPSGPVGPRPPANPQLNDSPVYGRNNPQPAVLPAPLADLTPPVAADGDIPAPNRFANPAIQTSQAAVDFVRNGGSLTEVPNEFWHDAVMQNSSTLPNDPNTKFLVVWPDSGNKSITRLVYVRDSNGDFTQQGYAIKTLNSAPDPEALRVWGADSVSDDPVSEVIGWNLLAAFGLAPQGAIYDGTGTDQSQQPNGLVLTGQRVFLPLVGNFATPRIDGSAAQIGLSSWFDADPVRSVLDEDLGLGRRIAAGNAAYLMGHADAHPGNVMSGIDDNGNVVVLPLDFGRIANDDFADAIERGGRATPAQVDQFRAIFGRDAQNPGLYFTPAHYSGDEDLMADVRRLARSDPDAAAALRNDVLARLEENRIQLEGIVGLGEDEFVARYLPQSWTGVVMSERVRLEEKARAIYQHLEGKLNNFDYLVGFWDRTIVRAMNNP